MPGKKNPECDNIVKKWTQTARSLSPFHPFAELANLRKTSTFFFLWSPAIPFFFLSVSHYSAPSFRRASKGDADPWGFQFDRFLLIMLIYGAVKSHDKSMVELVWSALVIGSTYQPQQPSYPYPASPQVPIQQTQNILIPQTAK